MGVATTVDALIMHCLAQPERDVWYSLHSPIPNRIAYVLSHGPGFSNNGYAIRTDGIARALKYHGFSILGIIRPGRPWDLGNEVSNIKLLDVVNDIHYIHTKWPIEGKARPGAHAFFDICLELYKKIFLLFKPSLVVAASNWETALPALIAAKQMGLPFFYEVRGFWEITHASRVPEWEKTPDYIAHVARESFIVKHSDHVFTLNTIMKNELVERGALSEKISIIPNAIWRLPELSVPSSDLAGRLGIQHGEIIVGYIGSLSSYEGLDDLVRACARLVNEGSKIKLLLVGSSNPFGTKSAENDCQISQELIALAHTIGFEKNLIFTGRIDHTEVGQYYALIDVVALPRKPWRVCEMVSPLKPLEAVAYEKAVLSSDVAPLSEIFSANSIGFTFAKGNIDSLTEKLRVLCADSLLRNQLGKNGRRWVEAERLWHKVVWPLKYAIDEVEAGWRAGNRGKITPISHTETFTRPVLSNTIRQSENNFLSNSRVVRSILLPKGRNSFNDQQKVEFDRLLRQAVEQGGNAAVKRLINEQTEGRSAKFISFCAIKAAQVLSDTGDIDNAMRWCDNVLENDGSASSYKAVARIAFNAVKFDTALRYIELLQINSVNLSEADKKFITKVRNWSQIVQQINQMPSRRGYISVPKRVLNILAFSLPYTSVGYATRSHGLAQGIKKAGWDIRPYTRPGFPYDFKPTLVGQSLPIVDKIDGITYQRLFDVKRSGQDEGEYLLSSIERYEQVIDNERPEIVHAASNYVTALPALIAARNKGVPFVYEVRGFWEVTRSSRDEAFENTAKYRFMQFFEGIVARQADCVITITTAMKDELITRGVAPDHIDIAFNSVNPQRFIPRPPNTQLAERLGILSNTPVIGYVGSFVDYEGLDDLIAAVAGLKQQGHRFHLLMVGDGAVFDSLKEQVESLDLTDDVILTGRVPHDEVEDYYSLIDIAPFPRKPWEVCELVSPLKPFEAMALKKAVVVSSTRALTEIVTHGQNGLIFDKGDIGSLRDTLAELLLNPAHRKQLGEFARDWIIRERSWDVAGAVCSNIYSKVING